jgi:hypothetical protein
MAELTRGLLIEVHGKRAAHMKKFFKPAVIALAMVLAIPALANAAARQHLSHHHGSGTAAAAHQDPFKK